MLKSKTGHGTELTIPYQPYVDGLRAVAILAVVLSHIGGLGFDGGYIGVDVFFVISGYLIIGQILKDLARDSFSFAVFWARRAMRILPPMIAVLALCMPIASFVLVTPEEFRSFGRELSYSLLMIVNFYFLDKQGYFDGDAIFKPLLHMWSLAVEEQFYVLAPGVLFFIWMATKSFGRRIAVALVATLSLLFFVSFIASVILTDPSKNIAFYMVFCRIWEFMVGGVLAYFGSRLVGLSAHLKSLMIYTGLLLIVFAAIALDESSVFPSYLAALPVLASALVIAGGIGGQASTAMRLLSSRPMVGIGLVSYGWYLWHWPLLSFARIHGLGEPSLVRDIAAVLAGLVAAIVTYFAVELPMRELRHKALTRSLSRWVVAGAIALSAAAVGGVQLYANVMIGKSERAIPTALRPDRSGKIMQGDPCWILDPEVVTPDCIAAIGDKDVAVLVGDSHARMLYPALKSYSERNGMALVALWKADCSPFGADSIVIPGSDPDKCTNYAHLSLKTLSRHLSKQLQVAIISGYWSKLYHGISFEDFKHDGTAGTEKLLAENKLALSRSTGKLADAIEQATIRNVVIVGPTVEFVKPPVECIVRVSRSNAARSTCDVDGREMDAWLSPALSHIRNIVRSRSGISVIDAGKVFCGAETCSPSDGEVAYFVDTNHVSAPGSERLLTESGLEQYLDSLRMKGGDLR